MDIKRKVELAEQAIRNITTHHDAPEQEIREACAHLVQAIDVALAGMPAAREAHRQWIEAELKRKLANKRR